jgi:proteasome beta subunit
MNTAISREEFLKEYAKHGTTTVGLICSDGVVLAAEKRATAGYLVAHKVADKIIPITDKISITIAGYVGDAQMLGKYLRAEIELYEIRRQRKVTVKAAATLLANILFGNRMSLVPFYVQILLAGHDEETGFHLFSLDPDGGNIEDKVVSTGSGSVIAYGVLEDKYKEGLATKDGVTIAARAIRAAMARDIASGEAIDIYVITDKGTTKIAKEEIEKLIK